MKADNCACFTLIKLPYIVPGKYPHHHFTTIISHHHFNSFWCNIFSLFRLLVTYILNVRKLDEDNISLKNEDITGGIWDMNEIKECAYLTIQNWQWEKRLYFSLLVSGIRAALSVLGINPSGDYSPLPVKTLILTRLVTAISHPVETLLSLNNMDTFTLATRIADTTTPCLETLPWLSEHAWSASKCCISVLYLAQLSS